jgi:phosphoribosylaminoimidazole-succinocarboxamide synthase
MPDGLVESQKLPKPIFTPSTKADQGEHDENIHPDKGEWRSVETESSGQWQAPRRHADRVTVKDICGAEVAAEVERAAIRLYSEYPGCRLRAKRELR